MTETLISSPKDAFAVVRWWRGGKKSSGNEQMESLITTENLSRVWQDGGGRMMSFLHSLECTDCDYVKSKKSSTGEYNKTVRIHTDFLGTTT